MTAQDVGAGLQLLGILLLVFGVAVVRVWLKQATGMAASARLALVRDVERRLTQMIIRRSWQVEFLQSTAAHAFDSAEARDAVTDIRQSRSHADRGTMTHEQLLQWLTDSHNFLLDRANLAIEHRRQDRKEVVQQLDAVRAELRAEINHATAQGWRLIIGGLALSAAGVGIAAWG